MVTKGIITSIDFNGNTCQVRIPFFETAGNDPITGTAIVSNTPGSYNGYKVGDVVLVAFEDGKMHNPVIIGKLYLGAAKEKQDPRGTINVETTTASKSASLPADAVLTANVDSNVPNTNTPFGSLASIANNLNSLNTDVNQLDRFTRNQFNSVITDINEQGEQIRSEIKQTADSIEANVVHKHQDGSQKTLGWNLDEKEWKINAQDTVTDENGETKVKDINIVTIDRSGMSIAGDLKLNGYPKNIIVKYAQNDSDTTHPALDSTEWSTNVPARVDGKYIWQWTHTEAYLFDKNSNSWNEQDDDKIVCITGAQGEKGDTGIAINNTKQWYILWPASSSTNPTKPTNNTEPAESTTPSTVESWMSTPPEAVNGYVVWTCYGSIFSDDTPEKRHIEYSDPVKDNAYALAQGKTTNYYSDTDPSKAYSVKKGDCWFKTISSTNSEYNEDAAGQKQGKLYQCSGFDADGKAIWEDVGGELVANKLTANYINALDITAKKITVLDGNNPVFIANTLDPTSGSYDVNIGGFSVNDSTLLNGTFGADKSVLVSTGYKNNLSIGGSPTGEEKEWAFVAGKNFGVTTTGELFASKLTISGYATDDELTNAANNARDNAVSTIEGKGYQTETQVTTITEKTIKTTSVIAENLQVKKLLVKDSNENILLDAGASNAYKVTIAGFDVGNNITGTGNNQIGGPYIKYNDLGNDNCVLVSPGYNATISSLTNSKKAWAFTAGNSFGVTTDGNLYANSVRITGDDSVEVSGTLYSYNDSYNSSTGITEYFANKLDSTTKLRGTGLYISAAEYTGKWNTSPTNIPPKDPDDYLQVNWSDTAKLEENFWINGRGIYSTDVWHDFGSDPINVAVSSSFPLIIGYSNTLGYSITHNYTHAGTGLNYTVTEKIKYRDAISGLSIKHGTSTSVVGENRRLFINSTTQLVEATAASYIPNNGKDTGGARVILHYQANTVNKDNPDDIDASYKIENGISTLTIINTNDSSSRTVYGTDGQISILSDNGVILGWPRYKRKKWETNLMISGNFIGHYYTSYPMKYYKSDGSGWNAAQSVGESLGGVNGYGSVDQFIGTVKINMQSYIEIPKYDSSFQVESYHQIIGVTANIVIPEWPAAVAGSGGGTPYGMVEYVGKNRYTRKKITANEYEQYKYFYKSADGKFAIDSSSTFNPNTSYWVSESYDLIQPIIHINHNHGSGSNANIGRIYNPNAFDIVVTYVVYFATKL